ncbi:MAG: response regulator [Planctomycetia bacterium]|nr:response regulator [Planctomycetia bacterium]
MTVDLGSAQEQLADILRQDGDTLREGPDRCSVEAELRKSLSDLAASRDLLADQVRTLQCQNSALEYTLQRLRDAAEATAAKGEFLANMSHEIRTPMTAILGFADILAQNIEQSDCQDAIQTIKRNGEYLLEIINDILDLSKIEAGRLLVEKIACSPITIVSDIVNLMKVRSDAKGLTLEVEYNGPIPESIYSDPTRLRQALLNLVGNAIKFTEVGGVRICIGLETNGNLKPCLRFDVFDTGIGMTKAELDRLFRPFTQADSSMARRFGGTGLGLTISKRLVEMLGGTISVRSDAGRGSRFTITVTTGSLAGVTMFENSSQCRLDQRPIPPPVVETKLPACRVLLADDGPDNQRLISFILRKAGATVEVVENGQLAFERIMESDGVGQRAADTKPPIDVVVMDMQMPVLDGYEASRRLRAANYTGPIIALTAHAMAGDRERCLAAGCTEYAVKPVDRQRLVELVARFATLNGTV